MASVQRNPRDSMKSTWRNDKSQWNLFHWLYEILSLHPTTLNKEIPVHDKSEKIAYLSNFQQQRWVICHAVLPIIVHQLYVMYTGHNLSRLAALALYSLSLKLIAIRQLNVMRALGHQYGYLDGDKHVRDQVPDHSVFRVLVSLISTSTLRPMLALVFAYSSAKTPSTINWLFLPLEIGLYGIVLDFWFYWYHRLMHQVEGLWKHHRTHHLTKHPNPLLTLYADTEQEFFDIVGIPVLAYGTLKLLGLPMGFYEWFICNQFVVYTELYGHSGLRMYCTPPSTLYWLLELFNAELVVEDHDLHHRQGWKKSHNYGKQTRLWDRIFGTCADRIESGPENIDYNNRVMLPLLP